MTTDTTSPTLAQQITISDDAINFVGVLSRTNGFEADGPDYFLEKPWKWEDEFAAWLSHGKPTGPDDAGWAPFLADVGWNA